MEDYGLVETVEPTAFGNAVTSFAIDTTGNSGSGSGSGSGGGGGGGEGGGGGGAARGRGGGAPAAAYRGKKGVLNTDTFSDIIVRGAPEAEETGEVYSNSNDSDSDSDADTDDGNGGVGGGAAAAVPGASRSSGSSKEADGREGRQKSPKKRRKSNDNAVNGDGRSGGSISSSGTIEGNESASKTVPMKCNGPGDCTKIFCFSCASAPEQFQPDRN